MRFMLLTIVMLLLSVSAYCPQDDKLVIFEAPAILPYEAVWNATCYVESRFDPFVIGDKNLKKKSYGIVQIRQTRLDDYYLQTGIRYSETDMFDPVKAKIVFMHYACQMDYRDTEQIARCWNGGDRGMKKRKTKPYYKLILNALEHI